MEVNDADPNDMDLNAEAPDLVDSLIADWRRERPDLDASAMGIVGRILILGEQLHKSAAEALMPYGMGYTDLDVLATLRRSGAPFALRPAQLLATVLIASGSMTACIDRLERRGWVERIPAPEDRRGRLIRLTVAGRDVTEKAIGARFEQAGDFVSSLADQDQRHLESLLRSLIAKEMTTEKDS